MSDLSSTLPATPPAAGAAVDTAVGAAVEAGVAQAARPEPPRPSLRRRLVGLAFSRASSQGYLSLFDQMLVSGTSFATSVIIGRTEIEALGVYSLAMTIVLLLRNLQSEMVTAPFSVYSHRHHGRRLATYAGSVMTHQLIVCVLGVLCVLMAGLVVRSLDAPDQLSRTLLVLIFAVPLLLLTNFVRYYCFARMRFRTVTLVDGLLAAVQIGGLLMLYRFERLTVSGAFVVMSLAAAASILVWAAVRDEPIRIRRRAVLAHWKRNWRFSRWALASQVVGCSTPYIIPWVISFTMGDSQTGLFAACVTTMGLSTTFVTAVGNLLTPRSARAYVSEGLDGLQRVLTKTLLVYLLVMGLFFVFILVTGDFLVVLFYGGGYSGAGMLCRLLSLAILLNSMSIIAGNGLWAVDKPYWNLPGDGATLLITLGAAVTLIPIMGITGAAAATVAGAAAGAAIRGATLWRVFQGMRAPSGAAA